MSKFILIDNSIINEGGHYYQYAKFCLDAAKELGYEPILAVNKKYEIMGNHPWKIYPVYEKDFWKNFQYDESLTTLYYRFEQSKHKKEISLLLRIFGKFVLRKLLNKNKIMEFCKDTEELLHEISLSKGDLIFIPTSGLIEMFGISEYVKNHDDGSKPSWHFLFRRNIYDRPTEMYSYMYIKIRLFRLAFEKFLKICKIKSFFYTDSDQLTTQYDEINLIKFHTLPIPHTIPKVETKSFDDKIIVTYLGDARREKGYQYLPHIVQDLWSNYVESGKISFVIQSNYNIPKGEPIAVVAKNQLETFPPDKVRLITKSPDPNEYRELLTNSSIILLPYDNNNYYARSSGILVEALSCGIPVLVPSGTWLARQFVEEVYLYHASLREKMHTIESLEGKNLDIRYENDSKKISETHDKVVLDWKTRQAHCWFRVPPGSSSLLVTIFFDKENTSSAVICYTTQMTLDKLSLKENGFFLEKTNLPYVTTIIPLDKNTRKIWLGLKHPYSESLLSISNVRVDILKSEDDKIPLSSVGTIYDSPDEISEKIVEMVNNYSHYLTTARDFSDKYYEKHNAKSLVKELIKTATASNEYMTKSDEK